jgi:hypothetical protein
MNGKIAKTIAVKGFALVLVLAAAWEAQAQDAKAPYLTMAPVGQYLMVDRNTEIALARSAAPAAISNDAEVLVLGRHGYETAVRGKNGFICLVERSWSSPVDSPEFWNPKIRAPNCYNPPAARTILPLIIKMAEWALAGLSKAQIFERIKAVSDRKELPALEPGAMCYMMSKEAYLTDEEGHNMSHLMFYLPRGAAWGANLRGSPVMQRQQEILGTPEPVTEFLIPVLKWSDGTPQRMRIDRRRSGRHRST